MGRIQDKGRHFGGFRFLTLISPFAMQVMAKNDPRINTVQGRNLTLVLQCSRLVYRIAQIVE